LRNLSPKLVSLIRGMGGHWAVRRGYGR
jgi:hypothetical protein